MVADEAIDRLAERLVLGKLGPIAHTIRLTKGMSSYAPVDNMSLTLRDTLRRAAEAVAETFSVSILGFPI